MTTTHPADADLDAFALGTLSDDAQASVEAHLSGCPACVARAAETRRDPLTELLASAATPAGPPPELAGHPKYRVIRLLGQGGMGAVWLCEHLVMNRQVAVKVVRPGRSLGEVRAAARVSHPNIVAAHDADEAGDSHLLVMEHVEGRTLAEEAGPMPVAEACRAARDAARGLAAAHAAGLVHRDVKPGNLIRDAAGLVKVLDFGLAAGGDGGTPDYMAPEQADGVADARSDVYSLGCTLHHLLTGRPPFFGGAASCKLHAHRHWTPPPVPGVPAALTAVLARMMAKRPEDRYPTAAAAAEALEPFADPRPAARRWAWAAVLGVAAVLALGVAVYRIQTDTGELAIEASDEEVEVTVRQGGKLVTVYDPRTKAALVLRSGVYELEIAGKPSGLTLDLTEATLRRGEKVVATVKRTVKAVEKKGTGEHPGRLLRGHGWIVRALAFSPDGATLYSCSNDKTVRAWDVASGKQLAEWYVGAQAQCLAVALKGALLVVGTSETLACIDLKAGKVIKRFPKEAGSALAMSPSPDGARVAASDWRGFVLVWDIATGKRLMSWPEKTPGRDCWGVAWSPDGKRIASCLPSGKGSFVAVRDMALGSTSYSDDCKLPFDCIAYSPDGTALAAFRESGDVFFGGPDGKDLEVAFDSGRRKSLYGGRLAFGPGGHLVVTGDREVSVWDWRARKRVATALGSGFGTAASSLAVSPDGKWIAVGHDGPIRLIPWPVKP